jgi:lantibiotic biosynthesis protein
MTNDNKTIFLETAHRIGLKLCRDAIWSDNKCNWVGASMEFIDNGWKTVQRSFGTDMYNGTLGIGYFLSNLYAHTKDPIVRKTAIGCFQNVVDNRMQTSDVARIGFYTGWAGNVYVLQKSIQLLNENIFEKDINFFLDELHNCNLQKSGIDILAGSAGAIPILITQKGNGRDKHIQLAKTIADFLISIAHKTDKGWSWNTLDHTSASTENNLTGFSHGTAGIAWALLELHAVTKEQKYIDAAQKALDYEHSWFSTAHGNWPDLRNNDESHIQINIENKYGSIAWCHGAPGIGLSRLRAYEFTQNQEYKNDAMAAINTTANMISESVKSGQNNFSLCHGLGGNADLLIEGSMYLQRNELLQTPNEAGYAGISLYAAANTPWPCGLHGVGETPGLMLGLSGIGYFYLRLYNPQSTPSILIYPN